ncbi:hypothetical protein CDV31_014325 [Fusarium ambrosium]|uniref:Leptomycin B resistance protein pmd1 n=1 Tax=Fusarium ambrosium TaxID=131363 RepID=A0A428SX64_9HYPO|nr:hypothetical protein CDV31_014325 [Fusarium ambrosium]
MEKHQPPSDSQNDGDASTTDQSMNHEHIAGFGSFLRLFTCGRPIDHVLEFIGILAAIGSGTALALVNIVLGQFITLLTDFTSDGASTQRFMSDVSKYSLYFVYIGIARFAFTYIYATLFTYVAFNITRNVRHTYLRAALSQRISFFDHGIAGSVSMQATSNGKLIQSGIAEKLGLFIQSLATFVAAFIIAFMSHWKLTLIILCIMPALLIVVGSVAVPDSQMETKMLKEYAQAATYAESVLVNIRAVKAFSLESRIVQKYATYLSGARSRAASAASELFSLIDRKSSIDPFEASGQAPTKTSGVVDIEGINFSYPTRADVRVLDDFSLHVPAGSVTALVGPSGSGKSTIIGLLERWYDPQAGTIKLDGIDTGDLSLNWLRTTIRLVQQEPVLFNGTVFENIANGLIGTGWETASHQEQLEHEFIVNLPDGYDTRIGERGGLLSGGQKQRIAIARSIVSEPKILLLDEATSALDPHAEGIVQKALDRASKNRTTIVIAHKLATIRNADNIVVMSKGKIVEQGRHEDLVAKAGVYANMAKTQDLSMEGKETDDDSSGDEATNLVEPLQSLVMHNTADNRLLESLKYREDFALHNDTGLVHTVTKLVQATTEIKNWYIFGAMMCCIGAAMYPGQALLLGEVMDAFMSPDILHRGNFIALMYFVLSLGCLVVYFGLGWTTNNIAQASLKRWIYIHLEEPKLNLTFLQTMGQKVRRDLLSQMLKQDLRFFDRPENAVGALISRIDSHAQAIFELMGFNISLVLNNIVNILSCSILSVAISWKLGLVGVFAGLPPMLLAGWVRIRLETKMDADIDERFSISASIASETITAIRTVSSLAIEKTVLQRYTNVLDAAISGSILPLCNMMVWFSPTQSIECFILALGFWWGSRLYANGEVTLYQFMISFMGVYFSGQAGSQLFSLSSSFSKANSAANYYFWLTGLDPTIRETKENKDKGPPQGCKSIDFRHVQFLYPLAPNNRILKGVSLTIEPGQFVAFVGASGCGKSTMISLLERFYDPTTGSIVIDDSVDLADINPRLYRSKLALVQQEPTLFPGTIRENIMAAIDVATPDGNAVEDDRVEAACRAANVWDLISSLPEGLDTPCGQGGSQLSGGQRQRIAIARALVRSPSVILLDEATSALDTESERMVQKALMEAASSRNCITVAVAHRLSTVRSADRICVFYRGRIAESGTHDELVKQGGMYKRMCEAQSLS